MTTLRCFVALIGLLIPLFVPTIASAGPTCHGRAATIVGTPDADVLHGTSGDDVIVGLGGNDTIDGGAWGDDAICGDEGDDRLESPGRRTTSYLLGGDGNDTLVGEAAGAAGDLFLAGGPGDDVLDGSDPTRLNEQRHFAFYNDASAPVEVDLGHGIATGEGTDILIKIEIVIGSGHADTLLGADRRSYLVGGCGDDSIVGGPGYEHLYGGAWFGSTPCSSGDDADHVDGRGGNDYLNAGIDDSVLRGGAGDDDVEGGPGDDVVRGGPGTDVVEDAIGTNSVSGGSGTDQYRMDGPGRVDLAEGTATFMHGTDALEALEDVLGSWSPDIIYGDDGPNVIKSIQGRDRIFGRAGSDVLEGGRHRDFIVGGSGNDRVSGGLDEDTCRGGETYFSCERRL
jgi:Ca2+-binding RTX toxin-like protein